MTSTCQLCGATVSAERAPMLLNPVRNPEAAVAIAEISTFDLMAGRMHAHIAMFHQDQAADMSAIMFLAGKVYAMTWAENPDPEYALLRESWRTGILTMLQSTSNPIAVQDVAADASPSSSDAAPSGSNEKKSVRNNSN